MKRTSLAQMEATVASFKSSGLTQREFCEQQQLKLPTFSYWYRKVSTGSQSSFLGFTEVSAPEVSSGLEVVFPNGVIVRGIGDLSLLAQLTKWWEVFFRIIPTVFSVWRVGRHAQRFWRIERTGPQLPGSGSFVRGGLYFSEPQPYTGQVAPLGIRRNGDLLQEAREGYISSSWGNGRRWENRLGITGADDRRHPGAGIPPTSPDTAAREDFFISTPVQVFEVGYCFERNWTACRCQRWKISSVRWLSTGSVGN